MLNIALPKGRLGEKAYSLMKKIGYECDELLSDTRKLIFVNPDRQVKYFLVKPSDVAIYVENGAADIGVVGKDTLLEDNPDIYEILNLNIGVCRMMVAVQEGFVEKPDRPLKVATKFPNIAKRHFDLKSRETEIIKLHGSIELAPILGLSDAIVDIVETGKTLKENNLKIIEYVCDISARLIANKVFFKFKADEINTILSKLTKEIYDA